jgi:hypothetical protein
MESYHDARANEQSSYHAKWEYRRLVRCLSLVFLIVTEVHDVVSMTFPPYLNQVYRSGVPTVLQRMGFIYRMFSPI